MLRRMIVSGAIAAVCVLVVTSLPDIARYLRMRNL